MTDMGAGTDTGTWRLRRLILTQVRIRTRDRSFRQRNVFDVADPHMVHLSSYLDETTQQDVYATLMVQVVPTSQIS